MAAKDWKRVERCERDDACDWCGYPAEGDRLLLNDELDAMACGKRCASFLDRRAWAERHGASTEAIEWDAIQEGPFGAGVRS